MTTALAAALGLAIVAPAAAAARDTVAPAILAPTASQVIAAASIEFRAIPGADPRMVPALVSFDDDGGAVPVAALPALSGGRLWSLLRDYLTTDDRGPHLPPDEAARHLRRIWAAAPGVTL